jgi:hypothetical protein
MKYLTEQKWFMYDTFLQHCSGKKFCTRFDRKYPHNILTCKAVTQVTKLHSMQSMLDKNKSKKKSYIPIDDKKVGIWLAISVRRTTMLMFFHKTNSKHCRKLILSRFFDQLNHEEKMWVNLWMNNSVGEFDEVSNEQVTHHGLYPLQSSSLNPFYLWGTLKEKDCANNTHYLKEPC